MKTRYEVTNFFLIFSLAEDERLALPQNTLEKGNIFVMSRHATENNRRLKTQLLVTKCNTDSREPAGEKVWKNNGFFGNEKFNFEIVEINCPTNTLLYINQAYVTV